MTVMGKKTAYSYLSRAIWRRFLVSGTLAPDFSGDGYWWVKFTIDIEHPLAWSVVQELGHVLNYVSLPKNDYPPCLCLFRRRRTYMNGGAS